MQPIIRVLRALALLVGVWGVIALVGWLTDSLPPGPFEPEAEEDPEPVDAGVVVDAGAPEPEPVDAGAPVDATPPAEPQPPPLPERAVMRHTACDPAVVEPTLSVEQMVGDPRPEVAVGCGSLVQILAGIPQTGGLSPVRLVAFEAPPEGAGVTVRTAPPVAADVDGDSRPDLVLGFLHGEGESGTRGGALYLVRANVTGAFEPPERLAAIAAVGVVAAPLDARSGADVAALHRANAFARRPSEVWVFGGGAAPARTARLRTGVAGEALAVADLDRDGHRDLVALAGESERIDVFFGDGSGRFPRSATLAMAGAQGLSSGNLTGEAPPEVLVDAEGLSLLGFGAADALEARPIEAPEGFTRPRVLDLDGDGRTDVYGLAELRAVWLKRLEEGELAFETTELLTFGDGGFVPVAVEVADLDANGRLDAVVLGRVADGPWEVLFVADLGRGAALTPSEEAEPVQDAPLTLQLAP